MFLENKMDFQWARVIIMNHFDIQTINCDMFSIFFFVNGKDREGIVIKMNHCKWMTCSWPDVAQIQGQELMGNLSNKYG